MINVLPVKFSMCVKEGQDKLPTIYWLAEPHKRPCKTTSRFIANSSSCTSTELSKLFKTSCQSHIITYIETVYGTSNKHWNRSIKKF